MLKYCTREQIREIDRRAVEDYGIPGILLMENAGRGAADVAVEMLGDPEGKRVVLFCGRGNNGGDGYVIARHLHNRGAHVRIVLAGKPDEIRAKSEAGINLAIARNMGLWCHPADTQPGRLDAAGLAKQADLIVDALLGTGLAGDVRDPYRSLIRLINAADKPILSVDIPSGLDANTGRSLRAAVRAARTVTFVLPKTGFQLEEGPKHVGQVTVVDIGVPRELIEVILDEQTPAPE